MPRNIQEVLFETAMGITTTGLAAHGASRLPFVEIEHS
jgi:hypothetical protein